MWRRQPSRSSSSSNASDPESCFDIDKVGGSDSDTNLTDVNTDVEDYPQGKGAAARIKGLDKLGHYRVDVISPYTI